MSNQPILLIRVEGALQSWGEHSKWNYRDTSFFPTKSGVIGLLGCALGLERDNPRLELLSRSLKMACRADRRGKEIIDFQTVTADVLNTADGKKRSNPTFMTYKSYLQDSSFLIGLSGDYMLLKELEEALLDPKWTPYLGRKSCVPAKPLIGEITTEYESLAEAMEKHPLARRHDEEVLIEYEDDISTDTIRMDERLFDKQMSYGTRCVRLGKYSIGEGDVSK